MQPPKRQLCGEREKESERVRIETRIAAERKTVSRFVSARARAITKPTHTFENRVVSVESFTRQQGRRKKKNYTQKRSSSDSLLLLVCLFFLFFSSLLVLVVLYSVGLHGIAFPAWMILVVLLLHDRHTHTRDARDHPKERKWHRIDRIRSDAVSLTPAPHSAFSVSVCWYRCADEISSFVRTVCVCGGVSVRPFFSRSSFLLIFIFHRPLALLWRTMRCRSTIYCLLECTFSLDVFIIQFWLLWGFLGEMPHDVRDNSRWCVNPAMSFSRIYARWLYGCWYWHC